MIEARIISMDSEKETITIEVPVDDHRSWREYWGNHNDVLIRLYKHTLGDNDD